MAEKTSKEESFPIMFCVPQTNTHDWPMNEYIIRVYMYDRLLKDRSNYDICVSNMDKNLNDLDVWLKDYNQLPFEVTDRTTATPFNSELMDYVQGWYTDFTIQAPSYGICKIPFDSTPVVTGYTCDIEYTNDFLTCSDLELCPTIIQIQDDIIALSGGTDNNTFVTGGTFSNETLTLERNDNQSVVITGFTDEDIYLTGGTFNSGTLSLTKNDGNSVVITGFSSDDVFVTGGTYSNGTAIFTNNTGGTFNVSGFLTGTTDNNRFTTGFTYNNANTLTIADNSGSTYSTSINTMTGLTINGAITSTSLSSTTVSATTIYVQNEPWTIELIDAQTLDFYAPYALNINSITNILNSPTISLKDDGVAYTLGNSIASGSKISVSANTASVITLNITR